MYCFFDNAFLPEQELNLANNRAFEYGDGFFETIIVQNGKILYISDHFTRIKNASQILFLQLPDGFSEDFLKKIIQKLITDNFNDVDIKNNIIDNNNQAIFRIKIVFWRKNGGFYTPTVSENECNTHILVRVVPYEIKNIKHSVLSQNPLLKVAFSDKIKLSFSSFSSYKTLNALPYILAGIEKTNRNLDEIILLDTQNNISECVAANIFWIKNDKIFTPNLQTGCVGGVMREQVIRIAKEFSIDLEEGFFQKEHLIDANCLFTTNVTGIRQIQKLENFENLTYIGIHQILEKITQTIYQKNS